MSLICEVNVNDKSLDFIDKQHIMCKRDCCTFIGNRFCVGRGYYCTNKINLLSVKVTILFVNALFDCPIQRLVANVGFNLYHRWNYGSIQSIL